MAVNARNLIADEEATSGRRDIALQKKSKNEMNWKRGRFKEDEMKTKRKIIHE